MDLKGAFYRGAMVAWMGIGFGTWAYVDLGYSRPWLSFSDVPGGSMGGFVAAMAAVVTGWLVLSTLHQRDERAEWQEAGKQAGLRTADNGSPRN